MTGELRLAGGNDASGRVEVCVGGVWGTVSHDLRNTYYHATFQCVSAKHTNFDASEILLSQDVIDQLSLSHKSFLNSEFGLAL